MVPARDVVLTTSILERRTKRGPRYEAENAALSRLAGELARSSEGAFQKLAECAAGLCQAQSAGVSLLERLNGEDVLRLQAVTGASAPKPGSLVPAQFSPGGVALERRAVQLFTRPERYFTYLSAWPCMNEMLVAPVFVDSRPAGTIWVIVHDSSRELDAEDARLLGTLAKLAALAVRIAQPDRERRADARSGALDREPDQFLATLAHELRNPLAPIRYAVQIMREAQGDLATVAAARNMIERQLRHLVRLIDDLVDVSRIMQGRLELRFERVDIGTAIQAALETSRPQLEGRQQRVTVQRPEQPLHIEADLSRLAQVLANLLSNAAKYSPPGAEVRITAEGRDGRAVVTVADEGIGIAQHRLPRVFDLFPQVSRSEQEPRQGLGIGLTLVKRLVELHGGTVEARSEGLNRGSRFIVSLPLSEGPVAESMGETAAPGKAAPRPAGSRKILVVDDNKDSAMSLEIMLRLDGHEVQTAYDGLEALEVAERFRPEVILLDIGMPRLDGYATAHQLRLKPWTGGVRLVALTGWGQEEDKQRARDAGFDDHLVKPVDPDLLARVLSQGGSAEVPKVGSRDAPGG